MLDIDLEKRYKTVLDIINDLSKLEEHLDWQYKMIAPEQYLE